MFSSKFLSGANPLSAVSSAVNKFGLFGDDGEGNKNQNAPPQQAVKPSGEQQPGAGPGKAPQQQQGHQKSGQHPSLQKTQSSPKQGSPQQHGNAQTGPQNKSGGQQTAPKAGTQPGGQVQQGSPKPGAQQQILSKSGAQTGSPKASSQQQVQTKTGAQQQQPTKTGLQESTKAGPQKKGLEQGSPKMDQKHQGSPKISEQQHGSTKVGPQQQGLGTTPQQKSSDKPGPQQEGLKGPSTPGKLQTGTSSPGVTKAGSQSKAVAKSLCPVCNTTELNIHTKQPPNYKICTHCKTDVCSLCGFSPPDSDGHEWLCLTCQIQRAQDTSKAVGPSMKKTNKVSTAVPSSAAPVKNEMSAPDSTHKMQPTSAKVPVKGEASKESESQKQTNTASVKKMTPETQRRSQKPDQISQTGPKQSSATPASQQESGGLFGFGSAKTGAAKPEESVTGKVFGFGASIFSSASTLMASAVNDESKTTPPVSPKMQSSKQTKSPAKMSEQGKKQEQPHQTKTHPAGQAKADKIPSETPTTAAAAQSTSTTGQSTCPLCKVVLNVGTKDSPNYSTCTECKNTVCNQCGFNPMPNVKEGKEWLCLNCQVKRAAGGIETLKDTKTTLAQPTPQKISAPGSPQRKISTPAAQSPKADAAKAADKQAAIVPGQKTPQDSRKSGPQKQPDQTSQLAPKLGNATAATQQDSGGFFGLGGPKSQTDAVKPAESVTGKMFGFGASMFSSASTLISSAVQDEPKTTPPVSPKFPTAKKTEQDRNPEQPQEAKAPLLVQPKVDKPQSEPLKQASASPASKAGQSTCPLCKIQLNVGSKDPPNYNMCTECKNTVCNQCGFNPMPNVKEVEWLCLNCQMQRALGASEPPGTPMIKLQASPSKFTADANTLKKEAVPPHEPQKKDSPESKIKDTSAPGSPQRKPLTEQTEKAKVIKGPESQKQVRPAPGQKTPQEGRKSGPQEPPHQASQAGRNTTSTMQGESGGYFGFGSPKAQPDAAKSTESLGGKMFGFGSSIFSSASTLINSAVHDESKSTPPASPKHGTGKATKSPLAQRKHQEDKVQEVQQPKTSPLLQAKVEKAPLDSTKDASASPGVSKSGQSTCPLCKVELNIGSKEPPNYNKCTECNSTVCIQCGFNPMPNVSEVKEWLCLNCQMQRALSASELTGPPLKTLGATSKISPSVEHSKITSSNLVEPLEKKELLKSNTPPCDSQASPTSGRKTDQTSKPLPKQSNVNLDTQQESGNTFGLGGLKTGPDASKTTESMTGKVFGFGSSIFSSASTLISSAVPEDSRSTPPGSRKMSAPAQISPKLSAVPKISPKGTPTVSPKMSPAREPKTLGQNPDQQKKTQESYQSKEDKAPSQPPKVVTDLTTCPLCKVELNIGTKKPLNYNTCTECKTIVCNQCGFNPMPIGEVKEWLCLNCQMKRATGASEPPVPPTMKSQTSPSKVPSPAVVQLKDSSKPTTAIKKDRPSPTVQKREISEPVSPQIKQSAPSVQSGKPEAAAAPIKQASPATDLKKTQVGQKTGPDKPLDQASQSGRKQSNATATQQELGGFFGFGGTKSQPDEAKPVETVGGKMFGFGSSIFSSASTLITSAVQDQPKTTPPVSPKMPPAKEKSFTSQKLEQQKKTEPPQQTNPSPSGQGKENKAPSEPSIVSQTTVKPVQSICPLCKVELNMGSRDLPNYNTCTQCKNTVCNQCGFNPMPNETAVKEWLCLTCQMQRALGTQPPVAASVTSQVPSKPQKKDIISPAEYEKKESPQRKPFVTEQPAPAANKPEGQKQASPIPSQKMSQEPQKTSGPNKSPAQTKQTEGKQIHATAVTEESGGFFGFGGGKGQPSMAKPAESVSGKMLGFGSSIFSSASTLITSAVQDQPKTTPPVSPKMSTKKDIKSPVLQKKEEQTKTEQLQQAKLPVEEAPSEHTKAAFQASVKPGQSMCPLCEVELNMGSKDPPNYNICTECKNTVCNQCGFNPMPNVSEIKEWLCLTCQVQRALTATQSVEPPPIKPQALPNKVSTSAASPKDAADSQRKDVISTQKASMLHKNEKDSPTPGAPEKNEESKTPIQMDITQTTITASPPAKETAGTISASTKETTGLPPTNDVPIPTAPPTKEMPVSDPSKSLPAEAPQVRTDIEISLQKDKDLTSPSPPAAKELSEKKEEKAEKVQKSTDQLKSSAEIQPQQALKKDSKLEKSPTTSTPAAAQQTNQESGGLFSFGSPKSQRAASIATEAVTGKMLGFGSSLFSSASTLITSAVQEESRTTPPSSRKMSAPAQVSEKISASPKSSPPVSPRLTSAKEVKAPAVLKPHVEKPQEQPQQAKVLPTEHTKVDKSPSEPIKPDALSIAPVEGKSTCPLCKVELNMGSLDVSNYNTCTGCKTTVCNKCGFSPMPNVAEAKEWLCLNCQMQRALGASEPPGLPMIKTQPLPGKDVPAPMSPPQEDIPKPLTPKNELEAVTITKSDVSPSSQMPSGETPKGQSHAFKEQSAKALTSTAASAPPSDSEVTKPPQQKPPKAGTSPAKSAPPHVQPAKQESGGFFGFGGPKTQPTAAKSTDSVTGKMFGFGSSFLSSASTLITSAVQDEPKTTPPTPRKMSSSGHVSPKATPPASPKTLPAKDTKQPAVQKPGSKKAEKTQQVPLVEQAKVDKAPLVSPKVQADTQSAPKADQPVCPLCKVEINMGSKDPPNYNTCTECKTTVCSLCGFNPMPNVAEVKEWLCLNCQMQRALRASEPSPSKTVTPPASEQNNKLTLAQKEKPTAAKTDITQTIPHKKETPKAEAPLPVSQIQKTDPSRQGSTQKTQVPSGAEQAHVQDVAGQPQVVQLSQPKKPELKADLIKQEAVKAPQQPSRSATPPAKSAPPPAQPSKQESGGFFGFGGPKTQQAAKPAESVTGKMFGFGSSIFSSASTLITSAVQDEPKTTPPTPRKMSTTANITPKTTPPVSPKMPPAKETKPSVVQKPEPSQQIKPVPSTQAKVERAPPEATQVAPKEGSSTCPLCKVKFNTGTKDPPNYNTCTECKNTVCNLCGFNPMPHTSEKEWLCLNCQTQRALLGQLGDSEKITPPSPVSAKLEIQATPTMKKAETISVPTKEDHTTIATTQPTSAPIKDVMKVPTPKSKMEYVQMETTTATTASTQIKVETTCIPTISKVSPVTEEKQPLAAELSGPTVAPVQQTLVTRKALVPNTDVSVTVKEENSKDVVKIEQSVTELPKAEESETDLSKIKTEGVSAISTVLVTEAAPRIAADISLARVVLETEAKPENELTESTKSLQQVEVQPKSQEPEPVTEPVVEADIKEVADKLVEKIIDVTSSSETQLLSTKDIIIKEQDEVQEESMGQRKGRVTTGQIILESNVSPVTTIKPESKAKAHHEDQPQILPITHELNNGQVVPETNKNDRNTELAMPVKEEVKPERRRLSFQAVGESSESELTPSPSPKVQRRRLKVTHVSSSSEDIKTESADSSIEDEEFIRKQIMGMGDEQEMSLSEEEKENNLEIKEAIKEADFDNASLTSKSLLRRGSRGDEDSPGRKALPKTDTEIAQDIPETIPSTTLKKAIPVMRQRQSTDEEVESITESLSKGSSSVQASSFTPGSSPTSASSLEEDSDSSPIHRKVRGDKQHRKGKHRQPTQSLPTIEDSSEEEKTKEEKRARNGKDGLRGYGQPLSPTEEGSSTEDLKEVTIMDETSKTSGSEHSTSIDSELEVRRAVQRGRKPSPTVIPYIPSDPFKEKDTVTKSLKSAEEAYEEIIQKTKAIPGESPDIEPLYGGMAIEDYLYESLVEEPEIKINEFQEEEAKQDTSSECHKKLRSPEEVYEEMMQKKRELIMIEQEFQQAQSAMEFSSGASITGPSSVAESCVVTIPTEDTSLLGQTDVPLTNIELSNEVTLKKKKRPAPPRPSEPPKRPEVTVVPSTPSGSIGFVRPMVPQDPALIKALFPIPDLKITQCSSGEDEDDSLADEYGVGISSDITPSDDSETKDPSISPPLSDTPEMEPICVVCEIPEPKPIPTPISAPELTTTPSPVSPVSPSTSPASPDSSLASNATSSSPFQVQTPVSSDSFPLSTPTPPPSFGIQSPPEFSPSPSSIITTGAVPSTADSVSYPTPTTVIVPIPDVVSDPSKAQTAAVVQVKAESPTQAPVDMPTSEPVVVQMPDLVSSPSQVPVSSPALTQVSGQRPAPIVVSGLPAALVTAMPVAVSTPVSAHVVSAYSTLASSPGPVIVQMPDLVSTTSPISTQTPLPVSAVVTTPVSAQAKVVHSIPVRPAIPSMSPVVVPAPVAPAPAPQSTTIVKKKVPPPPPPRSTSVSLPEPNTEQLLVKTVQPVTPTVTATRAMGTTVTSQAMQSVAVDIQPRIKDMQPDSVAVPQVVTPTRQGHVVIIVPSVENISLLAQDTTSTGSFASTASLPYSSQVTAHKVSDIVSADTDSLCTMESSVPVAVAPVLSPKPVAGTKTIDAVEIPVADTPTPPPTASPKPTVYPKPLVPTVVTSSTTTIARVSVTTTSPSQIVKPPPPIPPKPISIPAGLVFSHKPGESIKPPPVAPKAATLPRTKEPPNALSLSLTRPVESKLGATSPKSPLSPRHAKCLQTYVVITLPSEPGSPTEGITVQAPVRQGSTPSVKLSGVQTTPSEQKTPNETFSAQATVRRSSVPTVRHPPPAPVPTILTLEQLTPSEEVNVQTRDSAPSLVQQPPCVADVITVSLCQDTFIEAHSVLPPIKKPYLQQQRPITQPLPPLKTSSEFVTIPPQPKVLFQPLTAENTAQACSISSLAQDPNIGTEVNRLPPDVSFEALVSHIVIPTVPVQHKPLTEVVAVPLQPEVVSQDRTAAVPSATLYPQVEIEIEVLQKEQDTLIDVDVSEGELVRRSPTPKVSPVPVHDQLIVGKGGSHSTEQELFKNTHTIVELPTVPQTVQPLEIPQHLPMPQPHLEAEKFELPADGITTESTGRMPGIAIVSPVPHPPHIETEVTIAPELDTIMPPTTITAELTHLPLVTEVQQMTVQPTVLPVTYMPRVYEAITSSVMSHSALPQEVMTLQPEREMSKEIITIDADVKRASIPSSVMQPQVVTGMPVGVITTEETTSKRRTSVSSIVQPAYTTSEIFTYPAEYEPPTQEITTEAFAATRRESITMQQPLALAQVVTMPAEKDIPVDVYGDQGPYKRTSILSTEHQPQKVTYSSEYDQPLEIITTEAYTRRKMPTTQDIAQGVCVAPVTITKIQQESIESQEIRGPEKVVSSMSHMYSSSISTSGQPPESLPSLVTQVVTTEVQRTTVSVVHERLPQPPPPTVAITVQPDIAKVQSLPKQNGKIVYRGDVVDLRTMKDGLKMTEQGMDLTPPESGRQSFSSDSSGRQITAVQPEIVNLSAEITPTTTLSIVSDSITIVTCTATIASYNNTPAEKPLDLQGPVTSLPLPLTTYKPFEPLAQIVYKPVNSQPIVSAVTSTCQDIPINLSFGALVSSGDKQPIMSTPPAINSGLPALSQEATGAMDLSNYKPVRAMVALSSTSPGVVTTVVEDDGTPVDLTAGRRSVCCDVIYKLPFTGSCRTQPPITTQPDRGDHHQYDNAVIYGIKGMDGIKASVSETNLTDTGLLSYDPKNGYDYLNGSSDGAIDLTAAKFSAGKALDYTSKATGVYPGMTTAPYSQITAAGFGVNSVLRTSDGIVYSSVAAPVPSTYAITTQPGSIFSTTLTPTSTVQNQSLLHPYGFIPTTDPGQIISFDTGLPKELLPTALADLISGYPEMYSDMTLEAIAASLDALASSPLFPGLDNTKMAQYQMEREFLELEKLKQLCLAEELEWERQEIQRYREQEQLMVQRELEELQALKQQLLLQQEEEHHAHMVAQQETYAQQKEQLQQIQQLQLQLQRQLDEHYGTTGPTGNLLDAKYAGVGDSGQYWPVKDESTTPSIRTQLHESQDQLNVVKKLQADQDTGKRIIDSGVQTDDEDSAEKQHVGRRKKNKRNIDSSAQTDEEDQDEWDAPTKARRRSRKHSSDGKHGSKVSSIAIQTVAEISVQTDHSGTIKRPNVQMDTKVEIIKHISAPENSQRGGSLSCQTDSDRKHTPIEVGYSTHLTADVPSKSKVFYTQVPPMSPEKLLGGQRMLTADPNRFSSGPRILKAGQKSLSDPKSLSPTTEDRMGGYYADSYPGRGSPSGTGKKVKRTLPDPPPEDDSLTGRSGYSTNSARRRLARSTTMARAKILQDIDKELDLVERESSKLRKKQAELDEEEKEIDAKLRYLEMGINRRKEALLKEREKRERAYLQGVAEERDYMSDSEVSNIREARGDGLERPRTAPQSEFDQFIPPQTEADSQYNTLTSPYSHYAQYDPQTQTTSHYTQQNLYQQQSLYHQQVSPYPTLSLSHGQAQHSSYQHALLLQQGKQRQTTLSDLEPKITTNYEVIRNQPLLIVPTSTESGYGVAHLGGKYGNLDLRLGLEERSMASSPMSSISADSFYADIDHHNARNYVLIEDIGELTKASTGLGNTGLGSGFNLPDKELSKADRLLRAAEVRRTAEVADFLGSSRLQGYGKGEDDTMEDPYELKLLKQQIKQEFRRGTEGLEHLTGLGLPQYLPSDTSFRHFPKGEKYSISRLTLEKQAAKQLPAAVLYQKQMKNKKALIDPKAITKFSPIQESRDLEPDFGSYMGTGASSVTNLAARARLLQDEITFGLRKNLTEQQKYLGSSLGANLAGSLNLGQSLGLGSAIRATAQDDGTYPSGTRSRPASRPSSRPSSVYGLDLSIKRDLSSSSLRLKTEGEVLDAAFAPGVTRAKPTSLPISQSRGRIPIVAQNSEEESPLSPVGQPMGMARASAGPLPPISADSRDQFGSSHSLPEVQQHMREESRTRGYDRDIAFIMDDLQGAMSDSEAGGPNWNIEAYHLRREDTDWFDKPREGHPQSVSDRRKMKLVPYAFPHTRIKLKRDLKDTSVSGNGLGIRVVGGKEIPGSRGEIGAYIAKVIPGGVAEQTGKVVEGMQVLEWNGVPLTGKTYEEVQCIIGQPCAEAELCVRLDLNMLSDPEHPQALEHHVQLKAGGQRSPGVDPKQLAAELQKVSQQQAPGVVGTGVGPGGLGVLSALERSALLHSGTGSAASSGVPSPGQPASPAISKKQRHKSAEVMKTPHPITGEIQLQINYDRNLGNLIVHVLQARNLAPRDNDGYSDPFVKVYLLPGRGADNKRRTKYAQKTMNPEWNQTVIYKNIHLEQLKKKTLEVTVWDYDRSSSNDFLGEVLIDLSNTAQLDNTPRWLPLKEQSESIEHSRAHHAAQGPPGSGPGQGHVQGQGQGHMSGPGMGSGHSMGQGQAPGQGDGSYDSPKNSVIKSRSHGIFPDPAKDMQMMPLEKSHSSPGSSKSSSDGQLRSHGPSRSQSKSSVTQAHLEDAGIAIAAAEAAVQQSRLQPRPGHRLGDVSASVVLSAPSLVGDAYGGLDGEEGEGTGVDSAIFQVPRIGKTIPNGTDKNELGTPENEGGKTQVMGEIKVALKKEVKTEGDQLVLEILQCRNITYKFKSPDHLPDLYVKLYVVNVATQKRIIKKKTRVCRHDREPSFNETFRFPLNPTGHSIQLFLVSNGGKFVKKTLIGEAYIWLDKVDMRKRVVSWHKLFVSSTQTNP